MHLIFTNSDAVERNSLDRLVYRKANSIGFPEISDSKRDFWVPVIKKVVLNLSDQQLLTGLAVLIAGFWTHCSISVYHFALVNDLAWFSANVHLTTLTVLQDYFSDSERHMLRVWRATLMVLMAFFLVASTVMEGHYAWDESWPYDAQCLFDDLNGNIGGTPRYWMTVGLILIFLSYSLNVIPLFKRPTAFFELWLETKPRAAQDQAIERLRRKFSHMNSPAFVEGSMTRFGYRLLIMSTGIIGWLYFALLTLIGSKICNLALDIFWFAYSLWSILGDRNIPPSEMDGSENAMTFGQIMPILLLSSTVLVFVEAHNGMYTEVACKRPESQLIRSSDQKKEMEEHSPPQSSQHSLLRSHASATATSSTSRSYATAGVDQVDDGHELEERRLRRPDTESGRPQASVPEGGPQRRPTFHSQEDDAQLGSRQSEQTWQAQASHNTW